ncbi:MAG TPA: flagellar hook-associated protein FlgL [Bacteroidota bacterium]|nr:flagellar hook-associated protein FlgL [Bacteroidota bacterium]
MRITEGRIAYDILNSVNNAREKIVDLQGQLASGKRVQKVSDDPAASETIMRLQASLDRNTQYQKNVSDAQGFVDSASSSLDDLNSLLTQVQEILVQAENGQQTSAVVALGNQVDGILQQAVSIANTQFNGKTLFGGTQTTTTPYALTTNPGPPATTTVTYSGNSGAITYAVGDGATQQVNTSGANAFGGTALFDLLIRVRDNLQAGTLPSAADQAAVKTSAATLMAAAGKLGTYSQSLTTTSTHLQSQETQLQSLMSSTRDTDVAEATLDLTNRQTMLNAALQTAAKILPPSLLDYLS